MISITQDTMKLTLPLLCDVTLIDDVTMFARLDRHVQV